jgi:hypothetical protein
MPKSSKPRKKYRPQNITRKEAAQALMLRLNEASGASADAGEMRDLQILAHTSLEAIEKGRGEEKDVYQLAFASSITLMFAEMGMGADMIDDVVKPAQVHLVELVGRLNRKESLLLTGPGMQSVRRLLELHDAQLEHPEMTQGLTYRAVRAVLARMAEGNVMEIPGKKVAF